MIISMSEALGVVWEPSLVASASVAGNDLSALGELLLHFIHNAAKEKLVHVNAIQKLHSRVRSTTDRQHGAVEFLDENEFY